MKDPYAAALRDYWAARKRVEPFVKAELLEALLAAHLRMLEAQRLDKDHTKG